MIDSILLKYLRYIDKNYGGTLIIFDRLFGTFEPEKEEVVYGITHSLNTWNPFYLQNHQWIEMFDTMAKTPGIFNKIRVFLDRGPGLFEFSL
jgi:alkylglycerol monooxygenase